MGILIHASQLGDIMTEPREKVKKEAGELSETAKKEIIKLWIANNYGKTKEYSSKYTDKGNSCEESAITMFSNWVGVPYFKNEQYFKNKYFIGTPDIKDDLLADVKNSWSMETFMKSQAKDYYEQLQAYMDITGIHHSYLAFCLINAPEWIIEKEIYYQQGKNPPGDADKIAKRVRENLTFDNVPTAKRMKVFELDYDPAFIEKAYKKVEAARTYYSQIKLDDVKPFNLIEA